MPEQPSISLSAQAELELELSLRGSLLVQQQRRIVQLEDELQRAWAEIDRLRTKIAAVERERQRSDDDAAKQPRYWTPEEHRLFMDAVQRYGWKDVKSIAQHVGTRTPTQVRTHAQKLFLRQQKEQTGIMQPVKNGRTDMPPGVALLEGPGGSAGASDGQLQARPPLGTRELACTCPAHASLALCAFARSPFVVWLHRHCRRRGILRRCKTPRRRAVCRAWRRGWAWLAK
jgi:SHAQKYF class myb-like DNA-binding protein